TQRFPQIEYPAMGGCAFADVAIVSVVASVRGGSKPRDRHILWRQDIRRVCDAITNILLGTRAGGSRLCDGFHPLLARSKRLPNVRPASARCGPRPGRKCKQGFSKENDPRAAPRRRCQLCFSFSAARPVCKSSGTTVFTQSRLHAEARVPTRMDETRACWERGRPGHC